MKNFSKLLLQSSNFLIGMVHFGPLEDSSGSPGFEVIFNNAIKDLNTLEKSGFDAVIFENNYDTIHTEFLTKKAKEQFRKLISSLVKKTNLPIGISVLWNDYITALEIAKEFSLEFIRIPVFVDKVRTNYGFEVEGNPKEIIEYQHSLKAEDICLLTDIQVKHSTLLNQRPISESAQEAQKEGSDGLTVTGKWTGDPPALEDLKSVRKATSLPIIIGSGVDINNFNDLKNLANAFIIGTSIKEGETKDPTEETNLKPWDARIDINKAKQIAALAKSKGKRPL